MALSDAELEEVGARLTLKDVKRFLADSREAEQGIKKVGKATEEADKKAQAAAKGGLTAMHAGISKLWGITKVAVVGIGAVGAALVGFGVGEAAKGQKTLAQTTAVLHSTGGVAHVSAAGVQSLADSISSYSGRTDEAVKQAENLLLVYTNVRNEVGRGNDIFNQATKAAIDWSQATGRDLNTAVATLGKVLQDPAKGMMFLRRAGVVLSQSQQDLIKHLEATGNMLGAQQVILHHLNIAYGGSAKAYGQTLPGAMQRFKAIGLDLLGKVFTPLLRAAIAPVNMVDRVLSKLSERTPGAVTRISHLFSEFKSRATEVYRQGLSNIAGAKGWGKAVDFVAGAHGRLAPWISRVVQAGMDLWRILSTDIVPVVMTLGRVALPVALGALMLAAAVLHAIAEHGSVLRPILVGLVAGFVAFQVATAAVRAFTAAEAALNIVLDMNPVLLIVIAVVALAAGLIYAYKHSETFRHTVQRLWADIKGAALAVARFAVGVYDSFFTALHAVEGFIRRWGPDILILLTGPFGLAVIEIVRHWGTIERFFAGIPGRLGRVAGHMWDFVADSFKAVINLVIGWWNDFVGLLKIPAIHIHAGPVHLDTAGYDIGGGLKIPKLHVGGSVLTAGLVTVRPQEETLALPQGAQVQTVSPGSRAPMAGGGAGATSTRQPIILEIDGREVARAVLDGLNDSAART